MRCVRAAGAAAVFLCALFACSSKHAGTHATGGDDASASDAADDGGGDAITYPAPYSVTVLDGAVIVSDSSKPNFQNVSGDVMLTGAPFAQVKLVLDLASPCFPFSNWKTDPPPSGQNWPADCDAFDRNFETSLVDPAADSTAPPLELVRAITPFGGPEHIEQDVTDVFNVVQGGKRTLHVNIPTYSDSKGQVSGSAGSWKVTARLDVTPGAAPANVLAVVPLFYGSIDSKFVPADIPFTLPAGTTRARLDYRVTGHGGALDMNMNPPPGCGGPAEEFCQRAHHVYADDALVKTLTPWRMDCSNLCNLVSGAPWGKYCDKDPCGLPASVDAPRANWCPGSLTPPISFTPAQLAAPGMHTVKFVVDGIYPGGQWRVSAEVYAYGG